MEEIEVGEYVRTPKEGYIGKLIKEDEEFYYIECNWIIGGMPILKKSKVKHSKNIIDLIEVGDYVNGDEVVAIDYTEDEKGNYINVLGIMEIDDDYAYPIELRVLNIKSIVTKKQFNSIAYRLEE